MGLVNREGSGNAHSQHDALSWPRLCISRGQSLSGGSRRGNLIQLRGFMFSGRASPLRPCPFSIYLTLAPPRICGAFLLGSAEGGWSKSAIRRQAIDEAAN
jgi:hypothetical protein